MIGHRMRDIVSLREGRHGDKRYSNAQLVERCATSGVRTRRVALQSGTKFLGILDARVPTGQIVRALGASAGLLTGWRVRQVRALTGINSVPVSFPCLGRTRRHRMVAEA